MSVLALAFICQEANAQIHFVEIPAYGDYYAFLRGNVDIANPTNYGIATLIFVEGLGWYSKPTCDETITPLTANGGFAVWVGSGGPSDGTATRFAAFVVPLGSVVTCTRGAGDLPSQLYTTSVANIVFDRPNPNLRVIDFAGFKWGVKTSLGQVGPGNNYFSDQPGNVWVDSYGWLHLRTTNSGGNWYSVEIYSKRVFRYGVYTFTLGSQVSNLDPNVDLGLFTWNDTDASFSNREIDIEASRFGNGNDPTNAQFVIQPYNTNGHLMRFTIRNDPPSVQSFDWRRDHVLFSSFDSQQQLLKQWIDTTDVPPSGTTNVRINLWIFNQVAPMTETEAIIQGFTFSPSYVDFDGDGKVDYGIWRPANGTWYVLPTSGASQPIIQQWGAPGDIPVTGDYDDDGKDDFAVWRPSDGTWYVLPASGASQPVIQQWGAPGDIPVTGDYDGDGKTDFAVWRPSDGTWYILTTGNPSRQIVQQWGIHEDIAVPGDYDGDGITDFAVWRPFTGTWYVISSANPLQQIIQQWGLPSDMPVPGDYDGDGISDFAVWRPSTGQWFIIPSGNPTQPIVEQWGSLGDVPVPNDYDNDLKTDFAVWRPWNGTWYVIPSSSPNSPIIHQWGVTSDVPLYSPPGVITASFGSQR